MMSVSITSIPSILTGKSATVSGSVCSSLKHGICMINFIGRAEFLIATPLGTPGCANISRQTLTLAAFGTLHI
jgi:hypothetical protein